jgi:hypothetical protein
MGVALTFSACYSRSTAEDRWRPASRALRTGADLSAASERVDLLRQALKQSRYTWLPIAILLAETVILVVILSLLAVETGLVLWFVAIALLTIFVFYFSNYILRQSFAPFATGELEANEFRKKEAENRARFFNAALAAVVAASAGIFGLNYSKNTASFDWKTIDAITIETHFPAFDNRMADLLTQYQILGPHPMKDTFPLYFPSTLRDGNEDLGIMNKVNSFSETRGLSSATASYSAFLQSAEIYVELAREMERASDSSQQAYSLTDQQRLKSELLSVQDTLRARFFVFRRHYCEFVNSGDWKRVTEKVQAIRNTDFTFRSRFCIRTRNDG